MSDYGQCCAYECLQAATKTVGVMHYCEHHYMERKDWGETGMEVDRRRLTLREHFATIAFEAYVNEPRKYSNAKKLITSCVAMADLMVEALDMTPEEVRATLKPTTPVDLTKEQLEP